jgi:hypothetical protein
MTLTAVALTAAGTGANAVAQSNARKSQQATMNANTAQSAQLFNERTGIQDASNQRLMGIEQGRYGEASGLEENTFATLLKYSADHADANSLADKGLVTTQQQLQNQRIQTKTLASAQQSGYLEDMADNVAKSVSASFPGSQAALTTANFAQRMAMLNTAFSSAGPGAQPSLTADDLVKQAYAAKADVAKDTILKEAAAGAQTGAQLNSASWADQLLNQSAQDNQQVAQRAALAKSQTADQLATTDASEELAQQHNTFTKGLNDWLAQQKTGAFQDWSQKEAGSQSDYFGRQTQSEKDYAAGMIGANTHLDDADTSLANMKIGATTADTTFGDLLKASGSIVAGAGGVKLPTFAKGLTAQAGMKNLGAIAGAAPSFAF